MVRKVEPLQAFLLCHHRILYSRIRIHLRDGCGYGVQGPPMGRQMGLDRLLADRGWRVVWSDDPATDKEYVQLRLAVVMTYLEYSDKRHGIVQNYRNGELTLPDMQSALASLDKDYESNIPTSEFPDWTKRAGEAIAKMKETHRKVKKDWAHAYVDGDRVKIVKGPSGFPLVDMSVLEARLLASEILSITNKQRRKSHG